MTADPKFSCTPVTAAQADSRVVVRETQLPSRYLVVTEDRWRSIAALLNLSPRELQIVQHFFSGENEAITAFNLDISVHTVHTHISRLYRKLDVHDRCELLLLLFNAYCATCSDEQCQAHSSLNKKKSRTTTSSGEATPNRVTHR